MIFKDQRRFTQGGLMRFCKMFVLTILICGTTCSLAKEPDAPMDQSVTHAHTVQEARIRARMLHEVVRGTLQVMHRDFFDEENAHAIPSASLEDVFHAMHDRYDVTMKWLTVQTDVVNVDHEPETPFEKDAAKALASGKAYADQASADRYRFAGPIRLGSQCLKCHVKRRTSNQDRVAGLIIDMPLTSQASTALPSSD